MSWIYQVILKDEIKNLINAGQTIVIPQHEIQYIDWRGVGYIAIDPETGAAGYMISGGLAGGQTLKEQVDIAIGIADGLIKDPKFRIINPITGEIEKIGVIALDYKIACYEWIELLPGGLEEHPPNPEFEKFIKRAQMASWLGGHIGHSIGLYLLYETLASLMTFTLEEIQE